MGTTALMSAGPRMEVRDPHAFPYPEGTIWDRLGHELIAGNEPEDFARRYGEPLEEVERLSDLFWNGYGRACWLAEAREYGLLEELVELDNDRLYARLLKERVHRDLPS
jgi:hypothetical protein